MKRNKDLTLSLACPLHSVSSYRIYILVEVLTTAGLGYARVRVRVRVMHIKIEPISPSSCHTLNHIRYDLTVTRI
jgi:hypothetical protein